MAMFQKTQQKTGDLTDDNPGVSPTLGLQKQYRGIAATKLRIWSELGSKFANDCFACGIDRKTESWSGEHR